MARAFLILAMLATFATPAAADNLEAGCAIYMDAISAQKQTMNAEQCRKFKEQTASTSPDPEKQLMNCIHSGAVFYDVAHNIVEPKRVLPLDIQMKIFKGCVMMIYDVSEGQAEKNFRGK